MINDDKKTQSAGDGSTNTQANNITVYNGITYPDAKEIAFKANFLELANIAKETARVRAEELLDTYLDRLKQKNAEAISELKNPGMQIAMYEAQKSYAKTGDKDLENLLVEILVERSETTERNLKQITLDEAIQIAPKITKDHLSILTLNFFVTKCVVPNIHSYEDFKLRFLEVLQKISNDIFISNASVSYLKYTGCITPMTDGTFKEIEKLITNNYGGLFMNGYSEEEISKIFENKPIKPEWLCTNTNDKSKTQLAFMSEYFLETSLDSKNEDIKTINFLKKEFNKNLFKPEDVRKKILADYPNLEKTFEFWKNSLNSFDLTSVGVAIAISNLNQITGHFTRIDEWIST